jgi:hypothetical protein
MPPYLEGRASLSTSASGGGLKTIEIDPLERDVVVPGIVNCKNDCATVLAKHSP